MKLQNYKIKPYFDSWNSRVDPDGCFDINPDFIESVAKLEPIDSYIITESERKVMGGLRTVTKYNEVFDKTFKLYKYTMSSGQKFYFDVDFDIDKKTFIYKEKE